MVEFVAPSGARVIINAAPWVDAKNLKKAIQKEVNFDAAGMNEKWIITQIFNVDGSESFDAAIWNCLKWCTYNDERITQATFDKKEARADYIEIMTVCVKENLGPLVESLSLKLLDLGILKKQAKNQESELTTNAS